MQQKPDQSLAMIQNKTESDPKLHNQTCGQRLTVHFDKETKSNTLKHKITIQTNKKKIRNKNKQRPPLRSESAKQQQNKKKKKIQKREKEKEESVPEEGEAEKQRIGEEGRGREGDEGRFKMEGVGAINEEFNEEWL